MREDLLSYCAPVDTLLSLVYQGNCLIRCFFILGKEWSAHCKVELHVCQELGDTATHRMLVEGGVTGEVTLDLEEG